MTSQEQIPDGSAFASRNSVEKATESSDFSASIRKIPAETGELLRTLQSSLQASRAVETAEGPSLADEQQWLNCRWKAIEAATQVQQSGFAIRVLNESLPRFESPHWKNCRQSTGRLYRKLIEVAGKAGHPADALDIFNAARQQLKLDKKLRRTLVDASVELDRHETLGTAYLCLDDLIDGDPREPAEFEMVVELIRRTIRVDLDSPQPELLHEHVSLIKRLMTLGDFSWTHAALAVAALRRRAFQEAEEHLGNLSTTEQANVETQGLAALVHYELGHPVEANLFLRDLAQERADETAGSVPVTRWTFLRRLCRLVLLLNGHRLVQEKDPTQSPADLALETQGKLVNQLSGTAWDLDAGLVLGCLALTRGDLKQSQHWVTQCRDALLKPWMVPLLSEQRALINILANLGKLDSPAANNSEVLEQNRWLNQVIQIKSLLLESQIEEAGLQWAVAQQSSRSSTLQQSPARLECGLVSQLMDAELALHQPQVQSQSLAAFLVEESESPPGGQGPSQLQAWQERLDIRRLMHTGRLNELKQRTFDEASPFAPPREQQRVALLRRILLADADGWQEELRQELGQRLQELATGDAALPLDRLHAGLWHLEIGQTAEAKKILDLLPAQLATTVEARIAQAMMTHQTDAAQAAKMLIELSERSTWERSPCLTLLRPWRNKIPQAQWGIATVISPHRLADMLQVVDLQIELKLLDAAVVQLKLIQEFGGEERAALAPLVGARFAEIAKLQIVNSPGEACRTFQRACECKVRDPEFCELLASAIADEAEEIVFDVLLEETLHAPAKQRTGVVGQKVLQLIRITEREPDDLLLMQKRLEWGQRGLSLIPDWDEMRRSVVWGLHRLGDHAAVIAISDDLQQKTEQDHTLRGLAFWELRNLDEAAQEFEAGQTHGWRGCASAAAGMQKLWSNPEPIPNQEIERILVELSPEETPAELAARVVLWRGAILLAANRLPEALQALTSLLPESSLNEDEREGANFLTGLAHLKSGDATDAEVCWRGRSDDQPILPNLTMPLIELGRIQQCSWNELDSASSTLSEQRKRGFESHLYHLAAGHLAARLGLPEVLEEHLQHASDARSQEHEALLGPLALFLKDEERFLQGRLELQRHQFAAAHSKLAEISAARPWPQQTHLWQMLSGIHAGEIDLLELEPLATEERSWSADAAAQFALFSLQKQDIAACRKWIEQALLTEPEHPLPWQFRLDWQKSKASRIRQSPSIRNWSTGPKQHSRCRCVCNRCSLWGGWQVNRSVSHKHSNTSPRQRSWHLEISKPPNAKYCNRRFSQTLRKIWSRSIRHSRQLCRSHHKMPSLHWHASMLHANAATHWKWHPVSIS